MNIPWAQLLPIVYLIIAGAIVYLMAPDEKIGDLVLLLVGAALTRVRAGRPDNGDVDKPTTS